MPFMSVIRIWNKMYATRMHMRTIITMCPEMSSHCSGSAASGGEEELDAALDSCNKRRFDEEEELFPSSAALSSERTSE